MAERKLGYWFRIKMFWSGIGWAFRQAARESFCLPRPSSLHTADELMEVVADLTSDHGGLGTAFPYARRALELESDHLRANEFMASYYLTGRKYSEALPYARLVAERRADRVFARTTLGEVWMGLGQYEAALEEFEAALAISSKWPGLWGMKAEALTALGRYGEASTARSRAADLT